MGTIQCSGRCQIVFKVVQQCFIEAELRRARVRDGDWGYSLLLVVSRTSTVAGTRLVPKGMRDEGGWDVVAIALRDGIEPWRWQDGVG
ncbi:hypothetical protein E2562_036877 [Oryza meyeriana var. granulata]|uniref:Uncharacterized protein n=1 Tax=Oryza meyeriana var. granulata TaxID=110450 RepID=A0A6G1CX31_9ORYZ|nr:hypothetical protein E2562_036877 [Oryza meyeriana var. granulata]